MSDFNSSLPVRTEANGDIAAKIVDGTTPSQALAVDASGKISTKTNDGAGTAITSTLVSGKQGLDVNIIDSVPTGVADESTFTYGSSVEQPIGGVYQDTSPTVTAGQTGAVRITATRGLHVSLRDPSGNALGDTAADGLYVKPTDGTNSQSYTAAGEAKVDITQPLPAGSNNIGSVNQGTSPWIVKDQADGPVAPGAVASFSQLAGGQYNSTPPTLTNTQQSALQLTASGQLITTVSNLPTTLDTDYGTVGANTLRTASEIGNATGAADFNAGATGAQTLRTSANQGTPNTAANGWPVKPTDGTNSQSYTASGEAKVDITSSITLTTTSTNFPSTVDTNYGAVGASTIRTAAEIGNATGAASFNAGATTAQTLRVASNLYDSTGTAFSASNPLPVTMDTISGTAVDDFKDASAIAANASDDHDYTVTAGKTFYFDQVIASASGKAKMVVAVETAVASGIFTTKFVQFNSTAETNLNISLIDAISVAAGVRVRVTMTNLDKAPQDLYSTIMGHEI